MFGLEVSLLGRVGYRLSPQMCTITFGGKSFLERHLWSSWERVGPLWDSHAGEARGGCIGVKG